jgi:hypothetical protein
MDMTFQQDQRLIKMLLDMQQCPHLPNFAPEGCGDVCADAIYYPERGYVPRAFGGASDALDKVAMVIVSNGPSKPIEDEVFSADFNANLQQILAGMYLSSAARSIHGWLLDFLDCVFKDLEGDLSRQLERVWITNSVHCTFNNPVKIGDRRRCAKINLATHLSLFTNPVVVLAGGQAQRIRREVESALNATGCIVECHSFSAPFPKGLTHAQNSWEHAANECKEHILKRQRS